MCCATPGEAHKHCAAVIQSRKARALRHHDNIGGCPLTENVLGVGMSSIRLGYPFTSSIAPVMYPLRVPMILTPTRYEVCCIRDFMASSLGAGSSGI